LRANVIFHETDHKLKPHIPRIIGKRIPRRQNRARSFLIAGQPCDSEPCHRRFLHALRLTALCD